MIYDLRVIDDTEAYVLGFFGFVFIVAGGFALLTSSSIVGQIGGLILWVIAAVFVVGGAVVSAIEREARGIGSALAMQAQPAAKLNTKLEPAVPAAAKKTIWENFVHWWYTS